MEFSGRFGNDAEGKLTELRIVPVSRKSRMVSAAMEAAASSASSVEAPRWGRRMVEGWFQRRSSGKSLTYLMMGRGRVYEVLFCCRNENR